MIIMPEEAKVLKSVAKTELRSLLFWREADSEKFGIRVGAGPESQLENQYVAVIPEGKELPSLLSVQDDMENMSVIDLGKDWFVKVELGGEHTIYPDFTAGGHCALVRVGSQDFLYIFVGGEYVNLSDGMLHPSLPFNGAESFARWDHFEICLPQKHQGQNLEPERVFCREY